MNPPRLAAPPLPYVVAMAGTRPVRLALGTARTWTLPMQVPRFSVLLMALCSMFCARARARARASQDVDDIRHTMIRDTIVMHTYTRRRHRRRRTMDDGRRAETRGHACVHVFTGYRYSYDTVRYHKCKMKRSMRPEDGWGGRVCLLTETTTTTAVLLKSKALSRIL